MRHIARPTQRYASDITNMSLLRKVRNVAMPVAYPINPSPYSWARFVASDTSRSVLPLIVLYSTGTNVATHNVRMLTNAEDSGFISGPILAGANQENVVDNMIAATANAVNILEKATAALVSQLTCSSTIVLYRACKLRQPFAALRGQTRGVSLRDLTDT
jgi:hypothetical protein